MVQLIHRTILQMDILIDYKTINIGKDGEEKTYDVIDMVIFLM